MRDRNITFVLIILILAAGALIQLSRSNIIFMMNDKTEALKAFQNFSAEDSKDSFVSNEKYILIYDRNESNSILIKNNILKTFEYMKKKLDVTEVSEFNGLNGDYRTVIVAFEALNKFPEIKNILNFAKAGGKILFAERPLDNETFFEVSKDLGVEETHSMMNLKGITLKSNVLIKAKGFSVNGDFMTNSSLDVKLKYNCNLLAVSEENKPLLWDIPYGSGKIMIFNGSTLNTKNSRGLISGMMGILNEDFIYPIANIKVTFIDDFPAPFPSGINEKIYHDYKVTTPEFYRYVWWPDILKGAKNYNLKYTGMIIEQYDRLVKTPFAEVSKDEKIRLLEFGREIIKSGGEIGIHGYNHQPLVPEKYIKEPLGYQPWRSGSDMFDAIKEVNKFAGSVFPRYDFTSYVPPSNILSPEGRRAVTSGMPKLKVISSVYADNDYGDAYSQEFSVNKDGIIEMPRITFGYEVDKEILWDSYNGLTSLGIFAHFIHPDDVLDESRNHGKSWEEMNREYCSLMKFIYTDFGWIRPFTATEGALELLKYNRCVPRFYLKDGQVLGECKDFSKGQYFILRTLKEPTNCKNCKVHKIDEGVYIVCAEEPEFSIKLS
ncbi:MAG: DUF2194 domain-containing protein [Bacillota bacterium]|nr:DUF2194 domain-containing protein [Bacillota bacterium]